MKLDRAIEILELFLLPPCAIDDPDTLHAIQVGIEALKSVKAQYDPDHQMMRHLLPGEDSN